MGEDRGRGGRDGAGRGGHDATADDAQAIDATDAELGVDDGEGIRADAAGAGGRARADGGGADGARECGGALYAGAGDEFIATERFERELGGGITDKFDGGHKVIEVVIFPEVVGTDERREGGVAAAETEPRERGNR